MATDEPTNGDQPTPDRPTPAPTRLARRLAPLLLLAGAAALLVVMALVSPFETQEPDLEVRQAYVGAGTDPAGAYLVVVNEGGSDDLVAATTSIGEVTLQRSVTDPATGEPTLEPTGSLRIEGYAETRLRPGGDQLLVQLGEGDAPPRADTTVPLELQFRVSEAIVVEAEVLSYDEIGAILLGPVAEVPRGS